MKLRKSDMIYFVFLNRKLSSKRNYQFSKREENKTWKLWKRKKIQIISTGTEKADKHEKDRWWTEGNLNGTWDFGYNSVMPQNPESSMNQGVKKHFIVLKKAQPSMHLYVVIKKRRLQISQNSYSLLTKWNHTYSIRLHIEV